MLGLVLLLTAAPADAIPFAEQARTHWAFRPLVKPRPPEVSRPAHAGPFAWNPIDAFLAARLTKAGLTPAPRAPAHTLVRRVHLTLTGLPPTPEEVEAFVNDTRPDAYRRLVEGLLARPGLGERYGRAWLDLARYADTNGYERDGDKPLAWKYRDWVIDALNADMPYDRFVKEQIAGDETPGSDARSQTATTFLRLGTWDDEPANESTDRYDQLDDVLGTAASVFLAQTLRCARCHDHKQEPFSQRDYYRMLAVFEPLKRPQRGRDDLTYPVGTATQRAEYKAAVTARDAALARTDRQVKAVQARIRERILMDATKRPAFIKTPPRTPVQWAAVADITELRSLDALGHRRKQINAWPIPKLEQAYIWHEAGPVAPSTHILRRGNPNNTGPEVSPGFPAALRKGEPPPPKPLAESTGRRLWLAEWIASPHNPLTARVIVNRLWAWHFGRGLAATTSDFGLQGDRPTHPELLDWLACELIESGWSLKHIHRLIVTSAAYQSSSAHDGPDAERKLALYGRWRQRRLDAEAVRDGMMLVSGQLFHRMHGPGVYPTLPAAVLATQSRPGSGWGKSSPEESSRRSVYVFAKRTLRLPELDLLDLADSNASCDARPASTTAPQALTLLNGDFTTQQARHLAARLAREAATDRERVRLAYRLALSREPTAKESARVLAFLADQARLIESESPAPPKDAAQQALASFCVVLLNASEFVYLD